MSFVESFAHPKMLLDATFVGNIVASGSLFSMQLSAAVELKMVKHQTDHGVVELCGLWLPNKVKPVMFEH